MKGGYGSSKVMPNNKMHYLAQHTVPREGAGTMSNPNHAKSLTGVSIVCGYGGQTNTDFGVQHSTRGFKDAGNPKGPGGQN